MLFTHLMYRSTVYLTLILLTWSIWWAPNNASRWQLGFNSAFKGLTVLRVTLIKPPSWVILIN